MIHPIYLLEGHGPEVREATTDFIQASPCNVGEGGRCAVCGRPLGSLRWEPPLRVEIEALGLRFGDLAFGPGDEFLVSERFKMLWEQSGLTGLCGWDPVEVVKVRHSGKRISAAPPPYYRVWAGRSDVAIDEVRSGVRWESPPTPPCDVCRGGGIKKGWERIVVDGVSEESVFIARGLAGHVLVDERFKRFCESEAITNCHLIPGESASRWF